MDRPPDALEGDLVPRFITSQPPTENPTGLEAPKASANPSFSITQPPIAHREDRTLEEGSSDDSTANRLKTAPLNPHACNEDVCLPACLRMLLTWSFQLRLGRCALTGEVPG